MRFIKLHFISSGAVFLGPAPRSRLAILEALLNDLSQRWAEFGQFTQMLVQDAAAWQTMQAIVNLLPRLDRPGEWGADITALRPDLKQIQSLFLYRYNEDGSLKMSELLELHQYEALPRPQWQQKENAAPIPSSGNADMDLLATLAIGFSVNEAFTIFDRLDAERLDRFLFYASELRRDPTDRENEHLANDYAEWKRQNQDTFREGLGIKFVHPNAKKG